MSEEALAEEGRAPSGKEAAAACQQIQHIGLLGDGQFPHNHHRVNDKAVKMGYYEECASHREITKTRKREQGGTERRNKKGRKGRKGERKGGKKSEGGKRENGQARREGEAGKEEKEGREREWREGKGEER